MNKSHEVVRNRRASILSLAAASILCGLFCVLASERTWPLIDGDGPAYFPPAVEWSLGRPLTNPVWLAPLDDSLDGPGGRRYIYHGFLYPVLIGSIARGFGGGARQTVAGAYIVHWLTAVVGAMAVLAWADVSGRLRLLLSFILPFSVLAMSVAWHGRVEPLALFIVSAVCLAWRWLPHMWAMSVAGAGTILLVFTSPVSGALAGSLLLAALVISNRDQTFGRCVAAAAVGGTVAGLLAIWSYPYPIADWVGGVLRHSRINLGLALGQGFVATWIKRPELPLLGVSFAVLTVGAAAQLTTFGRDIHRPQWIAGAFFTCLLLAGLFRFAFLKTEASYNAVVLMPLFACLALSRYRSAWTSHLLVFALMLPVVGLSRSSLILARQFRPNAVTFTDVRNKIRELAPFGCDITTGLWLAVDNVAAVGIRAADRPSSRFFVVQQTNTGRSTPTELFGYRLVDNQFGSPLTVLGLPLSRTSGGWEYAVYERAR